MVKWLEIGRISKKHFIPLLVPLFCISTNYIQKYQINHYNDNLRKIKECPEKNEPYNRHDIQCIIREYPFFLNIFFSKILSIFLFLYSKYLINEKSSVDLVETKTMRKYHTLIINGKRKIKAFLYLLLIGFLEIVYKFENYVTYNEPNFIELKLGIILLVPLLNFCFLKKHIYKHHVFSLILSFIGAVLICLCLLFITEDKNIYETKSNK